MVRCTEMPTGDVVDAALSVPPPADYTLLGAWVEHIAAPREDLASLIVAEALKLPQATVLKLLQFGAIHTCPVMPNIPADRRRHLPPGRVSEMEWRREAATAAAPGRRNTAACIPRRLAADASLPEHSYLRVHVLPKRFPAYHATHWPDRIVAEGEDFVVLNKPGGVPVAPTIDNVLESALAGAAAGTGRAAPLLITSRLDTATEGVLVLGKTADFVRRFNALVRGSAGGGDAAAAGPPALRKFYRALTAAPPPLGRLTHQMEVSRRSFPLPQHTLVLPEAAPGSVLAELLVLEVRAVQLGATAAAALQLSAGSGGAAGSWVSTYEVDIELLTGRTHQIRAQLAAAGCPLLGDSMYGPLASAELRRRLQEGDSTLELVDPAGRRLLEEPAGAIGLQACRLQVAAPGVFGEGPAVFEAGAPWWRAEASS